MKGFLLACLVAASLALAGCGDDAVQAGRKMAEREAKAQVAARAADLKEFKEETARQSVALKAEAERLACLTTDRLWVEGMLWHTRMHNSCETPTDRLFVRLAFYDAEGYRHGFANFAVEPLKTGERSRLDAIVPRVGAASAKVYAVTVDPVAATAWQN